jgi:hypothetical protein
MNNCSLFNNTINGNAVLFYRNGDSVSLTIRYCFIDHLSGIYQMINTLTKTFLNDNDNNTLINFGDCLNYFNQHYIKIYLNYFHYSQYIDNCDCIMNNNIHCTLYKFILNFNSILIYASKFIFSCLI